MSGPLKDIRVVDLSRVLAGPWATQLLADFGADVIKIERPGVGDDTRHWGPPWLQDANGDDSTEAAYFLSANRNKRSITANLAHEDGQQVVRDLIAGADVFLENYRVGTLAGFGLDFQSVKDLNTRLIYCSISAYGQVGSKAKEPGYDAMIQASAGLMSLTGEPASEGGTPQKVGVAIADIMCGMYAATAILAALSSRQQSGRGQFIDLALFDSQIAWLANQNMNYLLTGDVPVRYGTAHPNIVPYQAFKTADGDIMIAVGNDRQFAAYCECLQRPDLATDVRFASNSARVEHRGALLEILTAEMKKKSTNDWIALLAARQVPAGPIRNLGQVFEDDFTRERDLVQRVVHPTSGEVPLVANPCKFSATTLDENRAPPLLGQHTRQVLQSELGYSADEIESLFQSGAI